MNQDNIQTPTSIPNSTAEFSENLSISSNNYALANSAKQHWMIQKHRAIAPKFSNIGINYVNPGNGSEDAVNRQQGEAGQNNITQAGANNYNRNIDSPNMTIYTERQTPRRKRSYEEQNNFIMHNESHPLKISNVTNNFPDMMQYNQPPATSSIGGGGPMCIVMKDTKIDPQHLESVFTGNILSNISNLANMPMLSNNIPAITNASNVTNVPNLPDMSNITNAINNSLAGINNSLSNIQGMGNVSAVIMMPVVLNMPNNVQPVNNVQYMPDGQGQYMSEMQRGYTQEMPREYNMHDLQNSREYRQRMSRPYIHEMNRPYNIHEMPRPQYNMPDYQRHYMPNNPPHSHAPLQQYANNQPIYSNIPHHPPPSYTPQYRPGMPINPQSQFHQNPQNLGYMGYPLQPPKPASAPQGEYHYTSEPNQTQININQLSNPSTNQQLDNVLSLDNINQQLNQQQPKNVKNRPSHMDSSKQNKSAPKDINKRVLKNKKASIKEIENNSATDETFILPDAPPNSGPSDTTQENQDLQLKIVKVESLKEVVEISDSPPMEITEKITIPYNDQSMDNNYYLLPDDVPNTINKANANAIKKIIKF